MRVGEARGREAIRPCLDWLRRRFYGHRHACCRETVRHAGVGILPKAASMMTRDRRNSRCIDGTAMR